ncbi:MAG: peptidase M14 family protein, partial [Bacillota bacterium]|nr:peptidase M14 family protein [Bacillota bacterium]
DADFRDGAMLAAKIDVLVLPADRPEMIIGPTKLARPGAAASLLQRVRAAPVPPEYESGIGQEGVRAIAEFVRAGGRLVALDDSCALAIEALDLRVRNVVAGLDRREYSCKGSTLWTDVETSSRWAYGMPERALVLNVDSPVLEVLETFRAEDYEVVAKYPSSGSLLQSGWLIGGERIAGKAAMVAVKAGRGEAVLVAAPPQFRAQTHGTYKLLFNCLV